MKLSPTENHRHLMSQIERELQYEGGDVKVWQSRLRRKLRRLIGDTPNEHCALRPRRLWKRTVPLGTIEEH